MPQTIQIQQYGGPEQMQLVDLPVGEPGPTFFTGGWISSHLGVQFHCMSPARPAHPLSVPLSICRTAVGR